MATPGAGVAGVRVRRGQPARSGAAPRHRHPGRTRRPGRRPGGRNRDLRGEGGGKRAHDHDPDARRLRRHAPAPWLVPRRGGDRRGRGPAGRGRGHERRAVPSGPVRATRDSARQRPPGLSRSAALPAARRLGAPCAERAARACTGARARPCAGRSERTPAVAGRDPGRRGRAGATGRRPPPSGAFDRSAVRRPCRRAAAGSSPGDRALAGLGPHDGADPGGRSGSARHAVREHAATGVHASCADLAPGSRPRTGRRAGRAAGSTVPLAAARRRGGADARSRPGRPWPAQGRSYHWERCATT
jgi:hypothetical protein